MIRIQFALIFLLISSIAYSQVEDPNVFSVISEPLSELTSATGWSMQDNGRWASDPNTIPHSDSRTIRNPTPKHMLGLDNFIKLEIRKVLINDKQYNVLIRIYKDGSYEFPIIQEEWESFRSAEFFVFPAMNLEKVMPDSIEFGTPYSVNLDVFCYGNIENYNPFQLTDNIVNKINNTIDATNINTVDLVIALWPLKKDGEELIRFKFIKTFSKHSIVVYYLDADNIEKIFANSYYETQYYKFRDYIRDAVVYNLPAEGKPSDYIAFYRWGILKYRAGNYESAVEDFNKALQFNPDTKDFMIYSYLGNAKTKLRQFNSAIEDFDRALNLKPTEVVDYSNWVRNYFNRGVAKFYVNDLEGACEDWHKAYELGFGTALEYLNRYCRR